MVKSTNPFKLLGFHGKEFFCDREDELSALNQHMLNERNVVLHAWRRLGKTALLIYLKQELEKKEKANIIYVDLLGTRKIEDANSRIVNSVYDHFGKTKVLGIQQALSKLLGSIGIMFSLNPMTGVPEIEPTFKPRSTPDQTLNQIGAFLNEQKNLTVLIIDEFQEITKYTEIDAEASFRSFAQSFPNIRLIFSGSERNMLTSMFSDKNRPFYQSAQLLALDSIPLRKYNPFIKKHFKNRNHITDEQISMVYNWARGQTYAIQLQCNLLFEQSDPITNEMVIEIQNNIISQEASLFSNYANLLTAGQFNLLKSIAKEEPVKNPLSKEFIKTYNLGAASSVSSALKTLIEKELVVKEHHQYLVHEVLLSKWLQKLY